MKTIVEALKSLHVALGGSEDDSKDIQTISEMIDLVTEQTEAGGGSGGGTDQILYESINGVNFFRSGNVVTIATDASKDVSVYTSLTIPSVFRPIVSYGFPAYFGSGFSSFTISASTGKITSPQASGSGRICVTYISAPIDDSDEPSEDIEK